MSTDVDMSRIAVVVAPSTTTMAIAGTTLCLISPQTKDLFKRWLIYGIGTTFSMALLSVVVGIVLKLTVKISIALWGAKIINSLIGNSTEGLTSTAMQQGGIGLLLTALIVSVPPMAAMFFQGTLGSFMSYSAFGGGTNSPGPQGQPPGAWTRGEVSRELNQRVATEDPGGFSSRITQTTQESQRESIKGSAERAK